MQGSCDDCPAGYYCENKVYKPVKCPPKYYCPVKTEIPNLCPNGTYTNDNDTGLESSMQCRPCPAGSYCTTGV